MSVSECTCRYNHRYDRYKIVRDSNTRTVTLVANLVSASATKSSGTFARDRTIILGIMASPAKPQPAKPLSTPRKWWVAPTATESQAEVLFLGACYYWGAQTGASQFYPAFHNYSIYDYFASARKSGSPGPMNRSFPMPINWIRDEWLSQFTVSNCVNCSDSYYKELYASIANGVGKMVEASGRKNESGGDPTQGVSFVIPYTNARGTIWDNDTAQFMDEWMIYDIADPRWDTPLAGGANASWCHCPSQWCRDTNCSRASTASDLRRYHRNESWQMFANAAKGHWQAFDYSTDPVSSYTDMALHYINKMLTTFSDGIYYDNVFFQANFVPEPMGPAYVEIPSTFTIPYNVLY